MMSSVAQPLQIERKLLTKQPAPPALIEVLKFQEITQSNSSEGISPRSGHRIVCDEGNVYSFGGYLEHRGQDATGTYRHFQTLFAELWQLNTADGRWHLLPTQGRTPKELASHSAILYGKNLIIFGGTGVPFGGSSSNQMHICDLTTLRWSQVCTRGPPPTAQYGQACVIENGNFYVVGGTTGYAYSMDIYKLDMRTWTWESLFISHGDPNEPEPRYRHEICKRNNLIYILGGGTASRAYKLSTIPVFDVVEKKWQQLETQPPESGNFPVQRKCHGIVQRDHEVFVFGGYDSQAICIDIWKLDLDSLQWTMLSVSMPVPVYFHSCAITPAGCMYMFGGVTNIKSNTRTNRTFKIWLNVPSLKEMAWEVITRTNPNLSQYCKSHVLAAGVPRDFASRLYEDPPALESKPPENNNVIAIATNVPIKCINNCIGPQFIPCENGSGPSNNA